MGRRGRAPCCEKVGLNRGSWTPAEDMKLVAHIQKHGHGNWRALPKQAGLLRCGKSCRLRWINYLRPDIKRGNFTAEEEDTIIRLHEMLGNRWSKIASRLPGRTDNEIKNVFNTHLKKRLAPKAQRSSSAEYSCGAPGPTSPSSASNCSPPTALLAAAEDETSTGVPGEKRPPGDVIEIPVEADSDVWDLLEAAGSPPPAGAAAATPAGPADAIDHLLGDVPIAPELWNYLLEGDDESALWFDETAERRSGPGEDDVLDDRWVAYLEKELDLPEWPPSNGIVPHGILPTGEDGGGGPSMAICHHSTAPN